MRGPHCSRTRFRNCTISTSASARGATRPGCRCRRSPTCGRFPTASESASSPCALAATRRAPACPWATGSRKSTACQPRRPSRDGWVPAVDAQQAAAREWAVLSLVTGRRDEPRKFAVRTGNDVARTVVLPAQRRIDRPTTPVTWSRLPDGIGVIRFNNSLGEQAAVAAFDSALAELRDTRGLIVDLRDTPSGGTSAVALGILGRFVDARRPYQRHRIPRYGRADVERNWLEEVAPRGPFTYRAPLVVLVDHWTGSMAEGMAIGVRCDAPRHGGRDDDGPAERRQRRFLACAHRRRLSVARARNCSTSTARRGIAGHRRMS